MVGPRVPKWFLGGADTLELAACLLPPNERKFRNERKGVLPPLAGDDEGLEEVVETVGLPLTGGYRDGGTRPR